MSKLVAVFNQKGGVGKTTTAVNLAAAIGAKGYRVLLVDIDPQGNSTSGLGVNKREIHKSTYDMLIHGASAHEILIHTSFENLDLLPANMNLAAADMELVYMEKREYCLRNALAGLFDEYDYIFMDCPPSLGLISLNAMCATDTIIVPIQCEYFALEGMAQLMATLRQVKRLHNPNVELEGILLTMYDGRLNLTQQVVEEVKKFFPKKVFTTTIPRNVRLSEAPSFGTPVLYYDKASRGSAAYEALAEEFLSQNGRA